jgi:hypothetical protein
VTIDFDDMQKYLVRIFKWIAYVFKINYGFYYPKDGRGNGGWVGRESYTVRTFMFCITHLMSRRMRWAWNVARMDERRIAYRVLVDNLEVKRQLGKPRRLWQNNLEWILKEIGGKGVDWVHL